MTDFRFQLLEFLEAQPDWSGNVFPIVEQYLIETGKTRRISFDSNVIRPLEEKKYLVIHPDSRFGLNVHQNGQYHTDYVMVRMTYDGHDYLEELRKKKSPSPLYF
jgi:hypothetical protein